MAWDRQITIKDRQELEIMREAGKINAEALAAAKLRSDLGHPLPT